MFGPTDLSVIYLQLFKVRDLEGACMLSSGYFPGV